MAVHERPGKVYRLVVRLEGCEVAPDAQHYDSYKTALTHIAHVVRECAHLGMPRSVHLECTASAHAAEPRWAEIGHWGPDVVDRILRQDQQYQMKRWPALDALDAEVEDHGTLGQVDPWPRGAGAARETSGAERLARREAGPIIESGLPSAPALNVAVESSPAPTKAAGGPERAPVDALPRVRAVPKASAPTSCSSAARSSTSAASPSDRKPPLNAEPTQRNGHHPPRGRAPGAGRPSLDASSRLAGNVAVGGAADAAMALPVVLGSTPERAYRTSGWYLAVAALIVTVTWIAMLVLMTGGHPNVLLSRSTTRTASDVAYEIPFDARDSSASVRSP